jgi:hypothetical protein
MSHPPRALSISYRPFVHCKGNPPLLSACTSIFLQKERGFKAQTEINWRSIILVIILVLGTLLKVKGKFQILIY